MWWWRGRGSGRGWIGGRLRDVCSLPCIEGPKTVGGFFTVQGALEFDCWLAFAVVGQAEGAEVDGDARRGAYFFVRADGILWRDVHCSHEPLRAKGANGQEGEADFREALADGGKVGAVGGVSCEINCARSAFENIAAPKSFVAVGEAAA